MGVVDYADRQSKHISRRVFVEVLRRLQAIDKLSNYSYVGFGAYQFLDFDLVHRSLGIERMISIESDDALIQRCRFNAPYRGIDIMEGTATTVLPTLDWSRKCIVWLDYTQRLRTDEMADIQNVALRLQPGSVLAITLNCSPGADDRRRSELEAAVGAEYVPIGISDARLGDWGLAKTQRELMTALLHRTFADRGDGTGWQQLLNIHYRDGARMQMIAGVVDDPQLHPAIQACRFEDMPEVSFDAEAVVIEVPSLTVRERQALGKKLPGRSFKDFAGLPASAVESYARFYRWMDAVG